MAEFKVLHFPNTAGGQRAKIRSLQHHSEAGWTVVSETLEQGKFKGGDACCLGGGGFACCGPVGLLGALTAGHTKGTITVTLSRQGKGGDFCAPTSKSVGKASPNEIRYSLAGCLLLLIGGGCLLFFVSLLGNSPEPEPAQSSRPDYLESPPATAPAVERESPATPEAETMPRPVELDAISAEMPTAPSQEETESAPSPKPPDSGLSVSEERFRTWTDSSGTYSVQAEFVNFENGEVRLKKLDGNIISIAPTRLSATDRKHLETMHGIEVEKKTIAGRVTAVSDK